MQYKNVYQLIQHPRLDIPVGVLPTPYPHNNPLEIGRRYRKYVKPCCPTRRTRFPANVFCLDQLMA
jgi:hypothetical protein